MAKTAVGLFKNAGSMDDVVRDLEVGGSRGRDIRVLGEPREMAGSGMISTPRTDFEVELTRDLMTIGATRADAEAYVRGVRGGGVIVFATSSDEKANAAAGDHEPPSCSGGGKVNRLRTSSLQHGPLRDGPRRDSSVQTGRSRFRGGGARLFAW